MTASAASTARPKWAAIAWATKDSLFVEIPCKDGPPYICRFPRTQNGLGKALNVLEKHPETETRTLQREHPKVKRVGPVANPEAREKARAILKRMGLT